MVGRAAVWSRWPWVRSTHFGEILFTWMPASKTIPRAGRKYAEASADRPMPTMETLPRCPAPSPAPAPVMRVTSRRLWSSPGTPRWKPRARSRASSVAVPSLGGSSCRLPARARRGCGNEEEGEEEEERCTVSKSPASSKSDTRPSWSWSASCRSLLATRAMVPRASLLSRMRRAFIRATSLAVGDAASSSTMERARSEKSAVASSQDSTPLRQSS